MEFRILSLSHKQPWQPNKLPFEVGDAPPFGPETLPTGVTRKFEGWSLLLGKEENAELLKWIFGTYFPKALATKSLISVPARKVPSGLGGINDVLGLLFPKGVSSEKVVVDLRD
ncbi:alcohol dehydrogenase [Fusarium agapanthi]|uniref:Alcohol dehydrogenase n=1 Tax=Fusarium agapanthi TaxID=1803897 RepID=A0A9P5EGW0_9HYPO|nr:alcohol dehydrogenase [Fusarium agapanthi]